MKYNIFLYNSVLFLKKIWVPERSDLSFCVFLYLDSWYLLKLKKFLLKKYDGQHIFPFQHSVCCYVVLNCSQCRISFLP